MISQAISFILHQKAFEDLVEEKNIPRNKRFLPLLQYFL